MATVTVSEKLPVVIPAALRRSLGIKPGTQLEFERAKETRSGSRSKVRGAGPRVGSGAARAALQKKILHRRDTARMG